MTAPLARTQRWLRRWAVPWRGPLCRTGEVIGALCFMASLTPSLVPRGYIAQGLLSGFCFGVGYLLGVALSAAWRVLQLPEAGQGRLHRWLRWLPAVCLAICAMLVWWVRPWQDAVRAVTGLAPMEQSYSLRLLLIALLTFAALLAIGRAFLWVARRVGAAARRRLPAPVAGLLGVGVAVVLFVFLANGVLLRGALHLADASFRQADALIPPEQQPPTTLNSTGGPGSWVSWEQMGRAGRDYASSGPGAEEITALTGKPALRPLRVYVGLPAADTAAARARLALRELQRQGGFERSVLVVITPTGTGWVDPAAVDSLEVLLRGDVASVAVQYSYLSSPLSLLVEPEYGQESAQALFAEVYGYWRTLPEQRRPRLFVHGLSLGAMNSERSVNLFDMIDTPIDGALWSGPPFATRYWRQVTDARVPGTPEWRPVFRDSRSVRFMNQQGSPVPLTAPWGRMRVVYLQYGSDAITFFRPEDAWRAPDWMEGPRAPDVAGAVRWYPLVSMLQLALDMLLADRTPMGYGHVFAPAHYVLGWQSVLGLEDMDADTVAQLQRRLDARRLAQIDQARGGG
ncbi:alpha/beta-hydrolase family protein [Stenotrophomonas sp. PS02289]|uniref:alpha/beta hydrolase n=1 Tax=Stenotrophomonas sp. PS02289 TaxID=2991422 RepID=UPI002499B47D|nr:alpha/beta-hydrolase family protein [Stenotrophomonas sp. PS02289]